MMPPCRNTLPPPAWRNRGADLRCPAAAVLIACLAGIASAETIRLGGPRDVVVDVEDLQGGFSVTVAMQPVSCFDQATNARINRSKALLYGLEGLAKSLDIDANQLAIGRHVSGITVEDAAPKGGRYQLRFTAPGDAIASVAQAATAPARFPDSEVAAAPPERRSQLFTCVHDHEMTIKEVESTYRERLTEQLDRLADAFSRDSASEHLQEARRGLETIDTEAQAAFAAAEREFKGDLRALAIEKASLGKRLAAAAADFEAAKAKAYARLESLADLAAKKEPVDSPAVPPPPPAIPK